MDHQEQQHPVRVVNGIEELRQLTGQNIGVSDWMLVTQEMVSQFAQATGDHQWIHVDPERARRESPFGGPVAHGFLPLSLLPALMGSLISVKGIKLGVNYGMNKVRFTSPMPVGKRVRIQVSSRQVDVDAEAGVANLIWNVVFEAEDTPKPVCVAEALSRYYF